MPLLSSPLSVLTALITCLIIGLLAGYAIAAWRSRNILHAAEKEHTKTSSEIQALDQRLKERDAHIETLTGQANACTLYTSPSTRDRTRSRMPSPARKKKNVPEHERLLLLQNKEVELNTLTGSSKTPPI